MAKYWWQDEEDEEEDLNAGARKVYLEEKGINAKSLAKRFNEIVGAQSETSDAALYNAERELKRFLNNVKDELKIQLHYQTCVNVWQNVIDNIKTYGFYEAKERVEIDLDGLNNATEEVDLWKKEAYTKTIGVGENAISAWIEHYKKTIEKHHEFQVSWQEKADEKKAEIDKIKIDLGLDLAQKEEQDIKNLADQFSKDYNKFAEAYPEDEFVAKMTNMVQSAYGYNRYLGAGTVVDLANKISYKTATNAFNGSATKDEGVER